MAGVLYVVATPIGNLEDITLRALRVLKEVNRIAAEDTRHTQTLLNHYGITTPLTSYHEHNERSKVRSLIERLARGENIALVSDAGTPAISDPGYRLVGAAIREKLSVVPIPGASAALAVLSASGLPSDRFAFEGFLPAAKQERKNKLQELKGETRTMIFYEAPHRLKESLEDLLQIFGDREISIGREVSKLHEEFLRGAVSAVLLQLAERDVKGELTLVVHGATVEFEIAEDQLKAEIGRLITAGNGAKEISELIGGRYGLAKREVYRRVLEIKNSKP
ncbi:MAG TPA: 16S rRNA (cytidine(1402)-2'-O)-methyltransferase [Candidatus Saccharimonadales bacterium]|nr:16S rRNA (cytidine(1402)-2'-O)-methyltransferase [Candidatus Saccharimonadales bacterium]